MKALLLLSVLVLSAAAGENAAMFSAAETDTPGVCSFSCPSGWHRYGRGCYLYVAANSSWSDAEARCSSLGASLASISDEFEDAYLEAFLDRAGVFTAWVGGFYFQTWRWVDQSRFMYSRFYNHYDTDTHRCVYLKRGWGWFNGVCSSARHSFCSKRIDSCMQSV